MHQIKGFLNFIDLLVGTFCGFTIIDIAPTILAGTVLSSISGFINLLLAISGLVYLVLRILHFYRISKLNIELKKQEVIEKQNANFYRKFSGEFLNK